MKFLPGSYPTGQLLDCSKISRKAKQTITATVNFLFVNFGGAENWTDLGYSVNSDSSRFDFNLLRIPILARRLWTKRLRSQEIWKMRDYWLDFAVFEEIRNPTQIILSNTCFLRWIKINFLPENSDFRTKKGMDCS